MKGNRTLRHAMKAGVVLGALSLWWHPVSAQTSIPDSTAIRSQIRDAQRRLERTRRAHLPIVPRTYGPYVASIGNLNIWVESRRLDPILATHPAIDSARAGLLALLDSAATALPHDGWVAGLRVQYHLDAEDVPAAKKAVERCSVELAWWCLALRGFIEHVSLAFEPAEMFFDSALALMDEELRCEWTDLSPVLSGSSGATYRGLSCTERNAIQEKLLWLGDPLYSTPGNELWTEHLSRHVYSRIIRNSVLPDGGRWNRNRHRSIIRYGRPLWWSTGRPNVRSAAREVIRHHNPASTYLFPSSVPEALDLPEDIWQWNPNRPRSWHVAGDGLFFADTLPHTLLRFPRGDSFVVAVAAELFSDTAFAPEGGAVSAFFSAGPGLALTRVDTTLSGGHAVLYATVPATSQLMSLEAVDEGARYARRRRYTIEPPVFTASGTAVSDLMVIEGGDAAPSHLADALGRYRPRHPFAPGDAVGLYWELVRRDDEPIVVDASLQLQRVGRSALRRLLEQTPLASPQTPVNLEWTEFAKPTGGGVFPWALSVVLPANLDAGVYELRLHLRTEHGDEFTRSQFISLMN